jgi:outer membrane protein OmpA-like peptidoglycan-associated protein
MKEIKENKKDSITVIENIYYEYGKWNITADGAKVLDKVVNIMKENPNIFIELSSHTDSRSSAEFNLELSRKRAKSAVDYILSKGIEKHRITGVGMGETKLVNYCADGVECTEEQHAQNRRTEFKVVKQKIN